MNYPGDSVNQTLPSAATGAHIKAPHLTHDTFGGDSDVNQYSHTGSRVQVTS